MRRLFAAGRIGLIAVLLVLVVYPLLWIFIRGGVGDDGSFTPNAVFNTFFQPTVRQALWTSLAVNIPATLFAGLLGTTLAWAAARTDLFFARLLERLVIIPFITMTLVGAFSWVVLAAPKRGLLNMVLLEKIGLPVDIFSEPGVAFVMVLYFTPIVFLFTVSAFRRLNPALMQASYICGRGAWETFLRVQLPLVAPSVLAALLLTFALTMEEFGIFAVLASPRGTLVLTTLIWQFMNDFPAQYSSASAVAALLLLITGLLAYLELRIRGNRRSFATIGERDYRAEPVTLGVTGTILVSALCGAYILLAVVLPVLGLTLVSFSRVYSASFSLAELSLIHYRALFADGTVRSAILNSFELAALGTFLAAVIGFFSAYVVNRSAGSGRTAIAFLSTIPAAVPGVVFAVGIFQAYIHPPLILYGTLWILLVAYIARHLPYGMRAISASLQQQHRDMERAARSCGAGWLRAMRTVVVPLIMPGVIAGSTIMFVAMVRELSASVLLYSSGNVVNSVLMLEQYSQGAVEKLSAYSLLLTILTLAIVLVAQRLTRVDLMTRT